VNKCEADFIKKLVEQLTREKSIDRRSIGVISAYKEQVYLLRNLLGGGIDVNTVDGFQGREKPIIIVSTVRTRGIGFLRDHRRMNVAITRARELLLVVGRSENLAKVAHWKCFIEYCREEDLVRSTDLNEKPLGKRKE